LYKSYDYMKNQDNYMKRLQRNSMYALCICLTLSACTTTKKITKEETSAPSAEQPAKPESSSSGNQKTAQQQKTVQQIIPENDLFLEKMKGVSLSVASAPGTTIKHKAFSAPYVVKAVRSDGKPVAGLKITVTYPESRDDGSSIVNGTVSIETDDTGTAVYTPSIPEYAFENEVLFQPAVPSSDPAVLKVAKQVSVTAPWKVRTDYMNKGGIICLVDYNTKGSPSSSKLLITLINKGFSNVGNVDFTKEIKSGNQQAVYEAAHKLVGSSASYFIYGTVKTVDPVTKTASGFTCSLEGTIFCLDMKTGHQIFTAQKTVSIQEKAEWKVIDTAKEELGKVLAEAIMYGM